MELQNANGVAAENTTAKENTKKGAPNGEAKKPSNGTPAKEVPQEPVPAAEAAKPEAVQPVLPVTAARPQLSLESKLKLVEDLHRRSIQRNNLIGRIKQLEGFEVNLSTENDELEDNVYQGCKLIIEDDKKRSFVTTTPGLIRMVSQFIFDACHAKLAEIEATINFPG